MRTTAGKYNRLITIQQESITPDAGGGIDTQTMSTFCQRFAALKYNPSTVQQVGDKQRYENGVTFSIPYDATAATIDTNMTVLYGGKTYKIKSVIDVEDAHEEIQIVAVELVE